jgi:hypothetical protein
MAFRWLRRGMESLGGETLTPREMRQRRNFDYRQRIRQGSTPVIVSSTERNASRRKQKEEEVEKRKMDRAFLKALEKRK